MHEEWMVLMVLQNERTAVGDRDATKGVWGHRFRSEERSGVEPMQLVGELDVKSLREIGLILPSIRRLESTGSCPSVRLGQQVSVWRCGSGSRRSRMEDEIRVACPVKAVHVKRDLQQYNGRWCLRDLRTELSRRLPRRRLLLVSKYRELICQSVAVGVYVISF
jgi:hypothetical protein